MTRRGQLAIALILASMAGLAYARGNLKELTVPLKFGPREGVPATSADLPPTLLSQVVEIRVDACKLDDSLLIGGGA